MWWFKLLFIVLFVIAFCGCIHTMEMHNRKQNIIFSICLFTALLSIGMVTYIL